MKPSYATEISSIVGLHPAQPAYRQTGYRLRAWQRRALILVSFGVIIVGFAVLWGPRGTTPTDCLRVELSSTDPNKTMYRLFDRGLNTYSDYSEVIPVSQAKISTADGKYIAYFAQIGYDAANVMPIFNLIVGPSTDGEITNADICSMGSESACMRLTHSLEQMASPVDPKAKVLGRMEPYYEFDLRRAKSQDLFSYTWLMPNGTVVVGIYNPVTGERKQPPVALRDTIQLIGWYLDDHWLFFMSGGGASVPIIYGWSLADNRLVSFSLPAINGQFSADLFDHEVAFSPDKKFLAIPDLQQPQGLHILELATGHETTFTVPDTFGLDSVWSSDSRSLVVKAMTANEGLKVYLVKTNGQSHVILKSTVKQTVQLYPFAYLVGSNAVFAMTQDNHDTVLVHLDLTTLKTDILEKGVQDVQELVEANGRHWYIVVSEQPAGLQIEALSSDLTQRYVLGHYDSDQQSRNKHLKVTSDQTSVVIEAFKGKQLTLSVFHAGADHADLLAAHVEVPLKESDTPFLWVNDETALLYQALGTPDSSGTVPVDLNLVTLAGQTTTIEPNVGEIHWLIGYNSSQLYATGHSPAMQLVSLNTATGERHVFVSGMATSPQFHAYEAQMIVTWNDAKGQLHYAKLGPDWQFEFALVSPIQDVDPKFSEVVIASPDRRWIVLEQWRLDRTAIITLNDMSTHQSTTLVDQVKANADMVAAWSPDSRYLALVSSPEAKLKVFDMTGSSAPVQELPLPSSATKLTWGCGQP